MSSSSYPQPHARSASFDVNPNSTRVHRGRSFGHIVDLRYPRYTRPMQYTESVHPWTFIVAWAPRGDGEGVDTQHKPEERHRRIEDTVRRTKYGKIVLYDRRGDVDGALSGHSSRRRMIDVLFASTYCPGVHFSLLFYFICRPTPSSVSYSFQCPRSAGQGMIGEWAVQARL